MSSPPRRPSLVGRWSRQWAHRVGDILRVDAVGGLLLAAAAVIALVWANSPLQDVYRTLRDLRFGPSAVHLDLSLVAWASDGLLAVFFFVAGLELKREFVAGDLRDPRRAALPVAAAIGGMIVPALIYIAITAGAGRSEALTGWAIPTATDIAFAMAVLAGAGTRLPAALRLFLLTLAVVDDLLAIVMIALFYTDSLNPLALILALLPLAIFALLVQRRVRSWWLLLPLALLTWALVHGSGVHATVAGVLLGFTVPVAKRRSGNAPGLAEHFERRLRPWSTGLVIPVFAFFTAGVSIGGGAGLAQAFTDPITIGVYVGLVVGKPVGIIGATWLVLRFTQARLADELRWWDVIGLAQLGGIGFTVSLLVGELAFGSATVANDHVKIAVLAGSLTAAVLATVTLRIRNAHYHRSRGEPDAAVDS